MIQVRGGLPWTKLSLADDRGPARIAFLGGSITEREGFRPLVKAKLRAAYPDKRFEFYNGGVASTGSTTGLFRFWQAALADGAWWTPPDKGTVAVFPTLVVVEAAVNDDQDERLSADAAAWNMEGVARQDMSPLVAGPDLLFIHFPNPAVVEALRAGEASVSVAAHERVAEHYGIPSVNVAAEVARRIDAGTLTWEEYGGTHPGPAGNALAAELVVEAISRSLPQRNVFTYRLMTEGARSQRPRLQHDAVDGAWMLRPGASKPEERGAFEKHVAVNDGWTTGVPNWPALPGACRERFEAETLLHADEPGATLTIDPSAQPFTALGLYVLAGPDAGALEVAVPGAPARTVELYHDPYSADLHYPRTVLLYRSDEPPAGPVRVTTKAGARGGTAVRVLGVGVGVRAR